MSKLNNRVEQVRKINRLAVIGFPVLFILVYTVIVVGIKFYGKEYGVDYLLSLLFTIHAITVFYVGIKQWILTSVSWQAMFWASIAAIIAGLSQLGLSYLSLLVSSDNIYMFVGAIITSTIIFLGINQYFINKIINK
jgi:membrane-associated PAP2 superfamily phosphatase